MSSRRSVLFVLLAGLASAALSPPAWAEDDGKEDDGGDDSHHGGSGGGEDSGSDDSGDDDSSGKAETEDGDNDGDDSGIKAQEALEAVAEGRAVSLTLLIRHLNENFPGKLIDVDFKQRSGRVFYLVKILQEDGKILRLRLDALTLEQQ